VKLDPNRNISRLREPHQRRPVGTIDQQRLPLRAMRGQLGGNLSAHEDFRRAARPGRRRPLHRQRQRQRGADEKGLGTAEFALHTDRFDLQADLRQHEADEDRRRPAVANTQDTQTLNVNLSTPACAWWPKRR
jgi:translocation and assembly module TamB